MAEEIAKAEELYGQNKFQEVYEYLLQFKDSDNPEILWRLVRSSKDRACMAGVSAEDKKRILYEAFEVSKRALQLGEDVGPCHKVGLCFDSRYEILNTFYTNCKTGETNEIFIQVILIT